MALPETFGVLRERRFRLLWIGQATSTIGDGLLPVALAFAVLDGLDRSATALWVSTGWCAFSTALVVALPSIRNLRRLEEPEVGAPAVPVTDPAVVVGEPQA